MLDSERRDENRFYCNRISVKDCSTGRVSGHQFTVNSCKEDGIGDLLKKLYTTDFTEKPIILGNGINVKLSEVSEEDIVYQLTEEQIRCYNQVFLVGPGTISICCVD